MTRLSFVLLLALSDSLLALHSPPVIFNGQVYRPTALDGRAWNIEVDYIETSGSERTESQVATGTVDKRGAFQVSIEGLPNGPIQAGEFRFYLLSGQDLVIGELVAKGTPGGYQPLFYGVRVPLSPMSENNPRPVMFFYVRMDTARPLEAEIAIVPQKSPFQVGEPVVLDVAVKNTSDRVLVFNSQNPVWDYDWKITHWNGTEAQTREYKPQRPTDIFRNIVVVLLPGHEYKESISISYMYLLSSPGVYKIADSTGLGMECRSTSHLASLDLCRRDVAILVHCPSKDGADVGDAHRGTRRFPRREMHECLTGPWYSRSLTVAAP